MTLIKVARTKYTWSSGSPKPLKPAYSTYKICSHKHNVIEHSRCHLIFSSYCLYTVFTYLYFSTQEHETTWNCSIIGCQMRIFSLSNNSDLALLTSVFSYFEFLDHLLRDDLINAVKCPSSTYTPRGIWKNFGEKMFVQHVRL